MKTKLLTLLLAGCVTLGCSIHQATATMINGAITFAGGAIFDTTSLATATRVNTFQDVTVMSRDGDFAGLVGVGDSVTMAQPWIFSPSTATPGLWSVDGFSYDLTSSTVILQNSDFLLIQGTGILSGNGFDPTPGTWSFTSQSPDANGVFSFSASGDFQPVPDNGATLTLLGGVFVCLELLRRRFLSA
jgi:hypothetical protein